MKTKFALTNLFLLITVFLFSQSSKLNQLDTNGKKDGKWIVYLDSHWKKVSNSTKASYYRYTFYDHGTNIYPMGPCGGKNYKLEGDKERRLLNGEYKWYNGKGILTSIHVFKDGEYVSCKEYYPSGQVSQFFDYTKKCEGQPHGWTVYLYDKKGNLTLTSPTCKDKNGKWPTMRD